MVGDFEKKKSARSSFLLRRLESPHTASCQVDRVSSLLLFGLLPVGHVGSPPQRATSFLPDPPGFLRQSAPDVSDWIVLHGGGLAYAL